MERKFISQENKFSTLQSGDFFNLYCAASLNNLPIVFPVTICGFLWEQVVIRFPFQLIPRDSEKPLKDLVDYDESSFDVLQKNHRWGTINHLLKKSLVGDIVTLKHGSFP